MYTIYTDHTNLKRMKESAQTQPIKQKLAAREHTHSHTFFERTLVNTGGEMQKQISKETV